MNSNLLTFSCRVLQKCKSSQRLHHQRRLSFNCQEQPTLTLAEVKKNTNHLREVSKQVAYFDFLSFGFLPTTIVWNIKILVERSC